MAKTKTQLENSFTSFTRNPSATNITYGLELINDAIRKRTMGYKWPFLEKQRTDVTVASKTEYELPADLLKLITTTITNGSTVWPVIEVNSRQEWDILNMSSYSSDIAQFYFVNGTSTIEYWPTPSSGGNTITWDYEVKITDLDEDDVDITGTVTVTNGSTSVTDSGNNFVSGMVGRYIQSADGLWYEIAAFVGIGEVTLTKEYLGTTLASQDAKVAQLSILPDGFELLPVYDAVADYYLGQETKLNTADRFLERALVLEDRMKAEQGNKTTDVWINGGDIPLDNPNNYYNV